MNGKEMVKIIDSILAERGMTQKEFCEMIGVQSSTMTGWRNGSTPTPRRIAAIEKCLGISFADYEKSEVDDETAQILQNIRERYDYRAVCKSAIGLSPSQAFEVAAFIERLKEGNEVVTSD